MSAINWHACAAIEQNRLVATTLFGWQPVPCEGEFEVYDSGNAQCLQCHSYDFIGDIQHGIVEPPNYVKDWNAAWEVFLKIAGTYDRYVLATRTPTFEAFACIMLTHNGDPWAWDEIYPAEEVLQVIATWTPERICLAALRAHGVEIIESEEKQ